MLGRTDRDFLPSAEADAIRTIDVEILATGEEKHFEERITALDGSVRTLITHKRRLTWPLANGTSFIIIAEIKDVTELRVAEQVLRASEEHHRSLIELHPQTPWVADPAGEIIEVGKEWRIFPGVASMRRKATGGRHQFILRISQLSGGAGRRLYKPNRCWTWSSGYELLLGTIAGLEAGLLRSLVQKAM